MPVLPQDADPLVFWRDNSASPLLSQDADPLVFWRDNSASPLLQPLLPVVASVSAVPAIEAICERLFKA
jgi:hypothetical protein